MISDDERQRIARIIDASNAKCPECGYALRGIRDPQCPECGFGFDAESLKDLVGRSRWDLWYALVPFLAGGCCIVDWIVYLFSDLAARESLPGDLIDLACQYSVYWIVGMIVSRVFWGRGAIAEWIDDHGGEILIAFSVPAYLLLFVSAFL